MSIMRSSCRVKTEVCQDSNMLHYLHKRLSSTMEKRRSTCSKQKASIDSLLPKLRLNRSKEKQISTMKLLRRHSKIDSIQEESLMMQFIDNRCNEAEIKVLSLMASLGTTASRNIPSSLDCNGNTRTPLKLLTNITKRTSTKRSTLSQSKRLTFKNNEDLFNRTLNIAESKKKPVTKELLFNTQIRLLNRRLSKTKVEKTPHFNTTDQLNHYLISQYHLGNDQGSLNSKRRMEISDETFSKIKEKKKEINHQAQTAISISLNRNRHYTGNDHEEEMKCTEENARGLMTEYYNNRQSENLTKANKFLRKLEDLSSHKYERLDEFNLISYANLSRVIKVMKLKEETKKHFGLYKKTKLREEADNIILATFKLGIPPNVKKKVKNTTQKKYKGIQGAYFGVPV